MQMKFKSTQAYTPQGVWRQKDPMEQTNKTITWFLEALQKEKKKLFEVYEDMVWQCLCRRTRGSCTQP